MLEKAVQAAIYEKALKNHYIEILYIDFEDTGKCIKLHQDIKLLNSENIFPEFDEQMFDDYICEKIMRYASGDVEDLNRVKQQMTMEAITQGTEEHIIHHVMVNFMLNGEMRFMQFDFTRESEDTKFYHPGLCRYDGDYTAADDDVAKEAILRNSTSGRSAICREIC